MRMLRTDNVRTQTEANHYLWKTRTTTRVEMRGRELDKMARFI